MGASNSFVTEIFVEDVVGVLLIDCLTHNFYMLIRDSDDSEGGKAIAIVTVSGSHVRVDIDTEINPDLLEVNGPAQAAGVGQYL